MIEGNVTVWAMVVVLAAFVIYELWGDVMNKKRMAVGVHADVDGEKFLQLYEIEDTAGSVKSFEDTAVERFLSECPDAEIERVTSEVLDGEPVVFPAVAATVLTLLLLIVAAMALAGGG